MAVMIQPEGASTSPIAARSTESAGDSTSTEVRSAAHRREAPWLILAGGGTGGHLFPGLAVADLLRAARPEYEIAVFGTTRPIDREVVLPRGHALVPQTVRAFPRRPWQWPGFFLAWRSSLAAAREHFERRRPVAVLGLGGYAAAPPVIVASEMGVPTALFNPDAVPGRANRRLARCVRQVFVQWPVTAEAFAGSGAIVHVTGCPVRPRVLSARREEGCATFRLDPGRPILLVTGASQGARSINLACLELVQFLKATSEWQILHVTGPADLETVRSGYSAAGLDARIMAFTEAMPEALAAADLVIARAGASTLAELTARGIASILLPYPYDRHQHQRANARVLERAGAAVVIDDAGDPRANATSLRAHLERLMSSCADRAVMAAASRGLGRPDAGERIAALLLAAADNAPRAD